jgi:tRNA(fMet)-specific endonuclease VapC
MTKYLLDTNACIALRDMHKDRPAARRNPGDQARRDRLWARLRATPAADLALSVISLGELRFGAEKSGAAGASHALLDKLCAMVTVLPLADEVCHHYGQVRHQLESAGQPIGPNDTWIAAHGRQRGCTVVTTNIGEFARVPGLQVEDWTR